MRHDDWQPRLLKALKELAQTPFQYGAHDCVLGAAAVADEITVDGDHVKRILASYKYSNRDDALGEVERGGGLQKMVTEFLNREPIPWGWARAGDAVLVDDFEGKRVLGICEGAQVICAGVGPLPMSRAVCAWRVD